MHSVKKLIWALIMQLLSTVYLIIVIIHGMIGSLQNRLVKFKTNIKMYQIFKPLKGAAFQKNQNKWRKKQQKHSPATHLFCFGCTCGYQYLLLTLVPPTQFPTLSQTDKSTGIHLDCMHLYFTLTWVRNHIHISEYFPLTWIGIQISWKIYVHKLTGSLTHNGLTCGNTNTHMPVGSVFVTGKVRQSGCAVIAIVTWVNTSVIVVLAHHLAISHVVGLAHTVYFFNSVSHRHTQYTCLG